ncbi:hypothetical protein ACF0H5_019330 [Mactra antiquata]
MGFVLLLWVVFAAVSFGYCQSSTLAINIVHVINQGNHTFTCSISSESSFARWHYLRGPAGTVTLTFQNGTCTASLTDSFLSDRNKYSYTCNSTVYQVTLYEYNNHGDERNNILACRDGLQPNGSGSTWIIKGQCDTCATTTMYFTVKEITEGQNITFVCIVSSDVSFVNWNYNIGLTAAMAVQNGQCHTSPHTSFLNNISEYIYTCNKTVYQVTRLNVQRNEHNDIYMCTTPLQREGEGSNWIIKIKASVKSVAMTPADNTVDVMEHTAIEFTCTTSIARPAASVYWYKHPNGNSNNITQITENITTTTDYNEFSVTTSTLRFVPARQHNNTKIFCSANNSVNTSPVKSNKKILNVLYKAGNPYVIQGSKYRVIENNTGTLSCSVNGGNPTPTLSWRCNNFSPANQPNTISNENTTTTLTWTVLRNHDGTCTCSSQQKGFGNESINVTLNVLYPPSKPVLKVNGGNVNGNISFIEGKIRRIECASDSKPLPYRYTWTGPTIHDSVNVQNLTFNTIEKNDTGQYNCSVRNTMDLSNGSSVDGINNIDVNVVVLYPPSGLYFVYDNQSGQNVSNKVIYVIEGDTFSIVCKSMDGVPSPTINWNGHNDNNPILRVEDVEMSRINATCTAKNSMQETNDGVVHDGNVSDTIKFNILVRPTIRRCRLYYTNQTMHAVDIDNNQPETLMIKEQESFSLECNAEGKPTPTVCWKTPKMSFTSSSSVNITKLSRQMKGDYVYTASSLLEPSFKDKQNITVNQTVTITVLYPPMVQPLDNILKLKGEQLNIDCNYTTGIPENTSIKWTKDSNDSESNTAQLKITSLQKNDTGNYTCIASNTMIQSGDDNSYIGQHKQSFYLDVQYEATIETFTIDGFTSQIVTVNESDQVSFMCHADSNPIAVMTLSDARSKILNNVTSNSVEHNIPKTSCSNAGTYHCLAKNVHNDANDVNKTVILFVNCYPRTAETLPVVLNITSEKDNALPIVCNVIAYPPPTFTWWQLVNQTWTLLNDSDKYLINSSNVQSNLTINSVSMEDFTSYKVIVVNDFGQLRQDYVLSPYDKPDPPTHFRHIEGSTTTSSIRLAWNPGFDNGPSQTFHIKYKKSSDTLWNYIDVPDNDEQTMEITLTELTENTLYEIVIFASNELGNSSESRVFITTTEAIDKPTNLGPLIGGIAGGVTGCIVLVIVIIVIIRRYPLFKGKGADEQDIRRSVSEDSDEEDGLVDNPMYASSSNVAPAASTSSDIYAKPVKPKKPNVTGAGDIYAVVNKTKKQDKVKKGQHLSGNGKRQNVDVYENFELDNDPSKKGVVRPERPAMKEPKLKIVNKEGLIYADLVFNDKPNGAKMVIIGDDPTPYDLVDFTKKAEPLPDSDDEEKN